jgi:hypothetical protein
VGRRLDALLLDRRPNIEVFTVMPKQNLKMLKLSRYLGWLLATKPVQDYLLSRSHPAARAMKNEQRARLYSGARLST